MDAERGRAAIWEVNRTTGKAVDVVTGFVDGGKAHGRPAGLALDRTGALLIADDPGNTVWRISGG